MINRKMLIVILSILAVLIVGLGIFGLIFAGKEQAQQEKTTYVDPGTGKELVGNMPLTQAPVDNPDPSRPMFIGFSTLTDRGLSRTQQAQVENAIYSYSGQKSLKFKEVSLNVDSIETTPPGSDSSVYYIKFMITTNRSKQYYVKVTYTDFTSCTTEIFEQDKTTLLFTQ
jgi:hypothetical protein